MNLSVQTVLRRMEAEIAQAQAAREQNEAFIRNLENIKLLVELLLDEHKQGEQKEALSKQIPALTQKETKINVDEQTVKQTETTSTYHEGTSIFDF